MSSGEIWLPAGCTRGLYEVSSLGRVRRVDSGHLIKLKVRSRDGYTQVDLSVSGRNLSKCVHILVCEAFHGPRPDGLEVAHGNGIRSDNVPGNLRWATPAENSADQKIHGTQICGERVGSATLTAQQVLEIRRLRAQGLKHHELADRFGVRYQTIGKIVLRERWAHLPEADSAVTESRP